MQSFLEDYVLSQIIVYILVFCRIGTAMMIMPGVGDSFVPPNIRILFALAFTVVVSPILATYLPEVTSNGMLISLIITEIIIGYFIGTVARVFMSALDTAGMLISLNIGISNAQIFNPQMAGQGSLIGAFLSILGAVLLFATDLHHILIFGMIDSYKTFPVQDLLPMANGMSETIVLAVSSAFKIGFLMATPFLVITLFLYIAMGILGRLMPQIQVFILALPVQIALGLVAFTLVMGPVMLYWLQSYDEAIQLFFVKFGEG